VKPVRSLGQAGRFQGEGLEKGNDPQHTRKGGKRKRRQTGIADRETGSKGEETALFRGKEESGSQGKAFILRHMLKQ